MSRGFTPKQAQLLARQTNELAAEIVDDVAGGASATSSATSPAGCRRG